MFKLFRGELKKIFLRPGIYIMTGLLILVLAVSPAFFSPTERSGCVVFSGETVNLRYADFSDPYAAGKKASHDISLTTQKNVITNLISLFTPDAANPEAEKIDLVKELKILYNNNGNSGSNNDDPSLVTSRDSFKQKLIYTTNPLTQTAKDSLNLDIGAMYEATSKLLARFQQYTTGAVPLILISQRDSEEVTDYLVKLKLQLESDMLILGGFEYDNYYNLDQWLGSGPASPIYITRIFTPLNKAKNVPLTKTYLQSLIDDYYSETIIKRDSLLSEIESFINTPGISESMKTDDINKIDDYMYKYLALIKNTAKILEYGMLSNISETLSDSELSGYIGFEDFNKYQNNEVLTKYKYLLATESSEYDYANVFALERNSNYDTNAYDYMYFTMELLSFLIIALSVVMAAGMIAQEHSTGTIKLLAIRPYKREKIMFAKILATMFFATIFILVGALVSFITGYIIYGMSSMPILVVFNATTAFVASPVGMIFIQLLSIFIKVWVFVLLAFTISTLFRSYAGATTISIMLYFITTIVSYVAYGATWLKYIIFSNLDIFKYFGGSFLVNSGSPLSRLLLSPVFADTNILYTGIIIGALLLVFHVITFWVFKKRDIT